MSEADDISNVPILLFIVLQTCMVKVMSRVKGKKMSKLLMKIGRIRRTAFVSSTWLVVQNDHGLVSPAYVQALSKNLYLLIVFCSDQNINMNTCYLRTQLLTTSVFLARYSIFTPMKDIV